MWLPAVISLIRFDLIGVAARTCVAYRGRRRRFGTRSPRGAKRTCLSRAGACSAFCAVCVLLAAGCAVRRVRLACICERAQISSLKRLVLALLPCITNLLLPARADSCPLLQGWNGQGHGVHAHRIREERRSGVLKGDEVCCGVVCVGKLVVEAKRANRGIPVVVATALTPIHTLRSRQRILSAPCLPAATLARHNQMQLEPGMGGRADMEHT